MPPTVPKQPKTPTVPNAAVRHGRCLVVQPDQSVFLPNLSHVMSGQIITPAQVVGLPEKALNEWLAQGVVKWADGNDSFPDVPTGNLPGAKLIPMPTAGPDDALDRKTGAFSAESVPSLSAPVTSPAEITGVALGKWDFDPAFLATKDLAQLNAMALDKEPGIAPFETIEEAIPVMSQHFK
jgi:hypothetical protein